MLSLPIFLLFSIFIHLLTQHESPTCPLTWRGSAAAAAAAAAADESRQARHSLNLL